MILLKFPLSCDKNKSPVKLSYNNLEELPKNINCPNLEVLNISNNELHDFININKFTNLKLLASKNNNSLLFLKKVRKLNRCL